jgi:hypothetical protein
MLLTGEVRWGMLLYTDEADLYHLKVDFLNLFNGCHPVVFQNRGIYIYIYIYVYKTTKVVKIPTIF